MARAGRPGCWLVSAPGAEQQGEEVALPVGQWGQAGDGAPGPLAVLVGQFAPVVAGRARLAGSLARARPCPVAGGGRWCGAAEGDGPCGGLLPAAGS
jgi:hypothetical protein